MSSSRNLVSHESRQSYIRKPLDYSDFADAVRETLQYWLGLNRPVPRHRVEVHSVDEGL